MKTQETERERTGSPPVPRVVAWEVTRACRLACRHCRAVAQPFPDLRQLTTEEGKILISQIAQFAHPLLILTGGDPLMRPDIFELARFATDKGLPVVVSPSGTMVTPEIVRKLKEAGVKAVSISIDGPNAKIHDTFRGVPGAFAETVKSLAYLRKGELPFQINTTVTRYNVKYLRAMWKFVIRQQAVAWDVFLLVPTGRATAEMEISPTEYEKTLHLLYELSKISPILIKVTCAPHYSRIRAQRDREPLSVSEAKTPQITGRPSRQGARGCMAGNGFCFISNIGDVYGCGYLPLVAGNVRQQCFRKIYQESPLFEALRNPDLLQGKCGICEYRYLCGGCRARALATYGNVLAEEPFCTYRPKSQQSVPDCEDENPEFSKNVRLGR